MNMCAFNVYKSTHYGAIATKVSKNDLFQALPNQFPIILHFTKTAWLWQLYIFMMLSVVLYHFIRGWIC